MIAPKLTKNAQGYFDLSLVNGRFEWAEDGEQAAQHAMVRVMVFKGEPSHGGKLTTRTEEGTDWYGIIFAMDVSPAAKELELKSRILGTPGVEAILEWAPIDWYSPTHTVSIDAKVQTAWGVEIINEDIAPPGVAA